MANDGTAARNKIVPYNRSDGSRNTAKDFDGLNGVQTQGPKDIWSGGTTMYVVDRQDDKV